MTKQQLRALYGPMQNPPFRTREDYLLWVDSWKTQYAVTAQALRSYRAEKQQKPAFLRRQANDLMILRHQSKTSAQMQWEASREKSSCVPSDCALAVA